MLLYCDVDDGSDPCRMDSETESAADRESSLDPVPLTRSSITPTPNIVYFNDWFGSSRLIGDVGDDRYSILPRSEAGRRLWRKQQKKKQRQAENPATTLSENVDDFKGTLPVDELLAFINNAKTSGESSNSKAANATPSKKERNIRRKKKPATDASEDSDQASVSTMDTSSCSGYEVAPSVDSIADAEIEISRLTAVPDGRSRSFEGVPSMDYDSAANEQDCFVVVQKKKKGRQPVSQMPARYGRLPYSSVTVGQAVRGPPAAQVSAGYETCRVDGTVSLTSDTESTSSYARDSCSHTTSVRSTSPDFPDLVMQGHAAPGRRNSTGNLSENVVTEKLPVPLSTISYAVVAAGGLRPHQALDTEWRHSLDSSADASSRSRAKQLGVSGGLAEYFCNSSVLVEASRCSETLPENLVDMPSRTDVDSDNSDPSTPTGYFSADSHNIISDDLAKELNGVKLQNTAKCLQVGGSTAVGVSAASLVDRTVMMDCDRATKLHVSPVVFLDIASEHRPVKNSLGVSFGFDSSHSVCTAAQSECSSSESGFSDCTVHTDTDKISSVASTDSAASPVDAQDFVPAETVPSGIVQTVTVGHCRPIVPFITTTGHQSSSHTPVGIVPPIPQVDRAAEPVEQDVAKDSKQDIIGSVISCKVRKDDILRRELIPADKQLSGVSSASSMCSVPAGSFNLHTAQIFLYTGLACTCGFALLFWSTLSKSRPNKAGLKCLSVHAYVRTYIRPQNCFFDFNEILCK